MATRNLGFAAQEVRDLEFVYKIFSVEEKATLDNDELRKALRLLGFKASHTTVQQMARDVVLSSSQTKQSTRNQTDFEGFLQIVAKLQGSSVDQYEEIKQAFRYLDKDEDGYITFADLHNCGLKIDLNSTDLQDMLAEADKDGDGAISEQEFITIMKQTNLFNKSS